MTPMLQVTGITKRFAMASRAALDDVGFDLNENELLTLVGASGSGKTSVLRIIAGLETADFGEVRMGNVLLTSGRKILVPPESRHMGFVFQHHALFPHLRVSENVGFGLAKGDNRERRISQLLELVGLTGLGQRYPHQLSGGERQRVALARALAPKPGLLLMDEPFSSLDHSLRLEMRDETRRLIKQQGAATILVTHDTDDALAVSDRIVVLREGVVQQVGRPNDIYRRPATRYIASSFGPCNFLDRQLLAESSPGAAIQGIEPDEVSSEELWIRPEDLRLEKQAHPDSPATGVVTQSHFHGDSQLVTLECLAPNGAVFTLQVRQHGEVEVAIGERLAVRLPD